MTIPLWVMLGFAAWMLVVMMGSIGVYRWYRILFRRASIAEWRADGAQGADWYQRVTRAHMNGVENLPVYGAIAVTAALAGVGGRDMDALAITFIIARIGQSLVHITTPQTERVVAVRFALFFTQVICMVYMGVLTALRA